MDISTTSAVEQVRDDVVRLNGMVGESSALAAQLASARRRRLLCVDRHRRRQLPQLPAVDRPAAAVDRRRFPTRSLELSNTDSETAFEFTSSKLMPSTSTETSTCESEPTVGEDAYRNPSTSFTSDLTAVAAQRDPIDVLHVRDTQTARRLAEIFISETVADWRTGNAEQIHPDGGQRLPTEASRSLVVEEDQPARTTSNCDLAVVATNGVTDNQKPNSSLTAVPKYHPVVSRLLHIARETASFRRFADSILSLHYTISENRSTKSSSRRVPSVRVVAVILLATVFFCLVFFYEDVCESSCEPANSRTRGSWVAALWNKSGLQFRHVAPPPV